MERVKKLEKQHGRISRYMGNGMYEKCGSELERPYPSPSKEKAYNLNEENKENMERIIKVNEFLAVCMKEDIEELYNSSAFNEITKAYAKKAMQNLVFKKEEVEAVQDEIKWLHDTMGAGMIVNE